MFASTMLTGLFVVTVQTVTKSVFHPSPTGLALWVLTCKQLALSLASVTRITPNHYGLLHRLLKPSVQSVALVDLGV